MLQNISWGQFLSVLLILILIYYVGYFMKYYQEKLIKKLQQNNPGHREELAASSPITSDKASTEEMEIDELEAMVNEIREFILEKAGNQANKEELTQQLESYVANFSGLHKPAFRYALTNYIIQQAELKCGVVFEEEELEAIWDRLSR